MAKAKSKSKIIKCVDCGREFENRGQRRKQYCIECGYGRVSETTRQLSEKKGPIYDKWRERIKAAAERL